MRRFAVPAAGKRSGTYERSKVPTWGWIVIAIAAVVVLAAVAWSAYNTRRRRGLQDRFGSEYDRTVADAPSRREAESELAERQKRREELQIRPLEPQSRDRYASEWHNTQARFVDDPEAAVADADRLIQQVMRERG
jgi:flagellar biosynthesis/type III secretory pathway M-ring protein FliF/YscJ